MGPKKPRRLNFHDVLSDCKVIPSCKNGTAEHTESHNICLETCFTAFPESQLNTPIDTFKPQKLISDSDNYKRIPLSNKIKSSELLKKRLAPLAQPETFSDTSSNCSSMSNAENFPDSSVTKVEICTSPPSQLLRRTPKLIGNLSTCTDDIRNIKTFEKFVKSGIAPPDSSNSSSNISYASGVSNKSNCSNDNEHFVNVGQCAWQRENVPSVSNPPSTLAEELLEEILEYAECADIFKSESFINGYDDRLFDCELKTIYGPKTKLQIPKIELTECTNSVMNSPLILSPSSLEIDPDVISNYAIDLYLDQEHKSLLSYQNLQTSILKVNNAGPSYTKTVTFSTDVLSIEDKRPESCDQLNEKQEKFGLWNFIPFRYFRKQRKTLSDPNLTTDATVEIRNKLHQDFQKNEDLPLLNVTTIDNNCQTFIGSQSVDSEV